MCKLDDRLWGETKDGMVDWGQDREAAKLGKEAGIVDTSRGRQMSPVLGMRTNRLLVTGEAHNHLPIQRKKDNSNRA